MIGAGISGFPSSAMSPPGMYSIAASAMNFVALPPTIVANRGRSTSVYTKPRKSSTGIITAKEGMRSPNEGLL